MEENHLMDSQCGMWIVAEAYVAMLVLGGHEAPPKF